MTSYNDLSVHELLDICYSIVIGQSLDNRALLAVTQAERGKFLRDQPGLRSKGKSIPQIFQTPTCKCIQLDLERPNSIPGKLFASIVIVFIMRPSSLGGGRILRRTLFVRLSVRLSVRPVIVTERHVAPPSELQ